MTPRQMVKRQEIPKEVTTALYTPLVIPASGRSAELAIFEAQSEALAAGKCPMCRAEVTTSIDRDQMVVFKCVKMPVFHEWRRTQGFLTKY